MENLVVREGVGPDPALKQQPQDLGGGGEGTVLAVEPSRVQIASPLRRQQGYRRWQPEADPGPDLDTDPALLHLHAHVGG